MPQTTRDRVVFLKGVALGAGGVVALFAALGTYFAVWYADVRAVDDKKVAACEQALKEARDNANLKATLAEPSQHPTQASPPAASTPAASKVGSGQRPALTSSAKAAGTSADTRPASNSPGPSAAAHDSSEKQAEQTINQQGNKNVVIGNARDVTFQ